MHPVLLSPKDFLLSRDYVGIKVTSQDDGVQMCH